MTFCIAMKVQDGLVGIADSRVTSGVEHITARKVSVYEHDHHCMFLMTSGLRAARDKALTYFEEVMETQDQHFAKLYEAVNAFACQIRRVVKEDRDALAESGLHFNLHTLIGGQLEHDKEHKLYLLYPQGNWVEVSRGTPYYLIGESSYGKPLLDRVLTYETPMDVALLIGYLAFDATRRAATDVDFPLDVVLYTRGTYRMVEHRFQREDVIAVSDWWQRHLREGLAELPRTWAEPVLRRILAPPPAG